MLGLWKKRATSQPRSRPTARSPSGTSTTATSSSGSSGCALPESAIRGLLYGLWITHYPTAPSCRTRRPSPVIDEARSGVLKVAHSLSAKKRIRQSVKRRARNRARKEQIKTEVRSLLTALGTGDVNKSREALNRAVSRMDRVASKNTIHKN